MDLDLDAIELRAKAAQAPKDGVYNSAWATNVALLNTECSAAVVLALVARARKAGRLEVENAQLRTIRDAYTKLIAAGSQSRKQAEGEIDAAETEAARLRTVVEKLQEAVGELLDCDPFIISLDSDNNYVVSFRGAQQPTFALFNRMRALLAQTAPDVPADQDGRAGDADKNP